MSLHIKRIYDDSDSQDGFRVLVDRLWPRGVSRERALIDRWLKEVAPSSELRKWFDHRADRFVEFTSRYIAEIESTPAIEELNEILRSNPTVTLLYGAKDQAINHAIVLAEFLSQP
jgi:uncharacterized protein YeaO (DUF488 family)